MYDMIHPQETANLPSLETMLTAPAAGAPKENHP
jgi:hypothetical protein